MKKSVILIIAIVYFASVFIVGIMGLQMRIYNPVVYINEINYRVEGQKSTSYTHANRVLYEKTSDGNGYFKEYVYTKQVMDGEVVKYEKGDVEIMERYINGLTMELKFDVVPANASEAALVYTILEEDKYKINGEVVTDKTRQPLPTDEVSGWVIMTKNADGNVELSFRKPANVGAIKSTNLIVKPTNANTAKRLVCVRIIFNG